MGEGLLECGIVMMTNFPSRKRIQGAHRLNDICDQRKFTNYDVLYDRFVYPLLTVGESMYQLCPAREEEILGAPFRILAPLVKEKKTLKYGMVGHGLDLARLAWTSETQVFSCQDKGQALALPGRDARPNHPAASQTGHSFLQKHPVDVLLVDEGERGGERPKIGEWLEHTPAPKRPKVVTISGSASRVTMGSTQLWRKRRRKHLERLGYTAVEWLLSSQDQGAALDQERCFGGSLCPTPRRAGPFHQTPSARATSMFHAEPTPVL